MPGAERRQVDLERVGRKLTGQDSGEHAAVCCPVEGGDEGQLHAGNRSAAPPADDLEVSVSSPEEEPLMGEFGGVCGGESGLQVGDGDGRRLVEQIVVGRGELDFGDVVR